MMWFLQIAGAIAALGGVSCLADGSMVVGSILLIGGLGLIGIGRVLESLERLRRMHSAVLEKLEQIRRGSPGGSQPPSSGVEG